jgi:hypothetical protein
LLSHGQFNEDATGTRSNVGTTWEALCIRRRGNGSGAAHSLGTNALRGQRELPNSFPSHVLTFSEPLEPIKLRDAALNVPRMIIALLLIQLATAAFLGAALFADFVSSFVQFP